MQNTIITKFYGNQVFSEFRKNEFLKKAKIIGCEIRNLTSTYLHLIESQKPLSEVDELRLSKLLDYGLKNQLKPFKRKMH